jgi:two-component system nitrate/nitrite response regulator NarL
MTRKFRIRVALVVDIGVYRDALARALEGLGFAVIESAASGGESDVALVDVTRARGLETLRELAERAPGVRLVAVAVCDFEPDVLACIEAGAVGYVLRDASLDDLADAVHRAVRDEPLASPHLIATLMRRVAALAANGDRASFSQLTTRELEVVELIEKGLSNKEIAARLSIAVTTVKNHVHSILEKLKVQRRGEAASLVRSSSPNGPTSA